jgi:hypothetical protein
VRIKISPAKPASPGSPSAASAPSISAPASADCAPKAAEPRQIARLLALLDRAEREEERGAEESVRDDVDHRAGIRERRTAEDRQQDQPRCESELYATTRFASRSTSATKAP